MVFILEKRKVVAASEILPAKYQDILILNSIINPGLASKSF
jgi:hypothetical protein